MQIGELQYPSLEGKVSEAEWRTRVELAAMYRLIPLFGWWDISQAPASAAVEGEPGHFLFNPLGFLFEEITASSLVKIKLNGDYVIDSPLRISRDIWYPMEAVHAARPDANFVLHSHDDLFAAMAARIDELLPISQSAGFALADGLAYHDYDGVETNAEAVPSLQRSLGTANAMLLRNHGLVAIGPTAYSVISRVANLQKACRIQLLAGQSSHIRSIAEDVMPVFAAELMKGVAVDNLWPALLRKLDRIDPSYKT